MAFLQAEYKYLGVVTSDVATPVLPGASVPEVNGKVGFRMEFLEMR